AAARGADEGADGLFRNVDRDIEQRLLFAVEHRDVLGLEPGRMGVGIGGADGLVDGAGRRLSRGHVGRAPCSENICHLLRSNRVRRKMAIALSRIMKPSRTRIAAEVRASKKLRFSWPCQR